MFWLNTQIPKQRKHRTPANLKSHIQTVCHVYKIFPTPKRSLTRLTRSARAFSGHLSTPVTNVEWS